MKRKITEKVRRHSGRKTPAIHFDGMNKKEIIEFCLEPQEYWNDWDDYRDGFRGCNDRKKLRSPFMFCAGGFEVEKWNRKLKKLIARRKIIQVKKKV